MVRQSALAIAQIRAEERRELGRPIGTERVENESGPTKAFENTRGKELITTVVTDAATALAADTIRITPTPSPTGESGALSHFSIRVVVDYSCLVSTGRVKVHVT